MSLLTKIFGDPHEKYVAKLRPLVERINALEKEFEKLSDEELRGKTAEFRRRLRVHNPSQPPLNLRGGELDGSPPFSPCGGSPIGGQGGVRGGLVSVDDILPNAFAAAREAAKRALGQRHYDVQLMGGIVLHRGAIAEMRTGEGKTLVATLPVYLNALENKGVHVVTVNDYLARRDAVWMGKVYQALGLSVGCIAHESAYVVEQGSLKPVPRKEAYAADITYGTNNEFGFDYLRDNMVTDLDQMVQGPHHYAIVDEVDSILVDEARTPLIISAPAEESEDLYYKFADLTARLNENTDYNVDEKMRAATLSEAGIAKLEKWLGVDNLYDAAGHNLVHHAEQSLRARTLYQRDKDYVVKDDQIIIVDEFTGRLMPGRRWSEGLHQAVEAKERVKIERESQTLATVTFQNYFRLYKKLAGMTGTAATESEEFHKIYGLDVVVIPTNKPMVRADLSDRVYRNGAGKFQAVAREIKERHQKGQPVLVGTISIEKNEILSQILEREGVPHKLLNAKNHEKEAEIIAQAGRKGAVTVATNMAGRGVDIILGGNPPDPEEARVVCELGGLFVMGTERHESRRIDNQLRGRSGRQGDPGLTQFYVSLEDDLMRIFAGDRVKALMTRFNIPEDTPIESKLVSRSIESAQSKVEQHNFDIRKHLLEYDDVLNKHREAIYKRRKEILAAGLLTTDYGLPMAVDSSLSSVDLKHSVLQMIEREIEQVALFHTPSSGSRDEWNIKEILEVTRTIFAVPEDITAKIEHLRGGNGSKLEDAEVRTKIVEILMEAAVAAYDEMEKRMIEAARDESIMRKIEKAICLRAIDTLWVEHLEAIDHLRRGIGLRAYGQQEPLVAYKKEAYRMFQELQHLIDKQVVYSIFKVGIAAQAAAPSLLDRRGVQIGGAVKTVESGIMNQESGGVEKVGRNDPCSCGSGKKYKRCHGA